MRYELTIPVLNRLGQILTERIKREIRKKQFPYGHPTRGTGDKYASGGLYNSVSYKIIQPQGGALLGTGPALVFDFGDTLPGKNYTLFDVVNFGVKKNRTYGPRAEALLPWMRLRGLKPRDKQGRFLPATDENMLSLAWAIKTNLWKYGIRPANLIGKGYKNVEELFERPPQYMQDEINDLFEAIGGDVENFFDNILEE